MRVLKAGAIYFALVFAVGWVLGPIREFWIVPHLGRIAALMLETPLMLVAMIVSARWVVPRFDVPYSLRTRIAIGAVALVILLAAELIGSQWVRGLSMQEYLASLATVPGLISLLAFLVFAAVPAFIGRPKGGTSRH
jgi:hypothetical protein